MAGQMSFAKLAICLLLTYIIIYVPRTTLMAWRSLPVDVKDLDAHVNTSHGHVRIAVCISGGARTFTTALSLRTIKAAFSDFKHVNVDFFIWLTNNPLKGDRNSKNQSYPPVSNGEVRAAAAYLAHSTPFGTFVLNEVNFHTSPSCDFGEYTKLMRDQSDEDVVTRSTQTLFKREKCFELVRAAEEELKISLGKTWKYTNIVSIRPDIFFYGPLSNETIRTNIPLLPAPAHGSQVKYVNGHVPNGHVAFLPRNLADDYFYLGRPFRECTGVFQGALSQEIEIELIKQAFALEVTNTWTVVPYTLHRHVSKGKLCERVHTYRSNTRTDDISDWIKRCNNFVSWFFSRGITTGQIEYAILDYWKSQQALT